MRPHAILAVLAACLAAPAAAQGQASSIAYIKDHNVWIAAPDGSSQHQVTLDGTADWAYGSPSQADDGTIVARKGTDIVRLRQNGDVLSSFDPPDTTDSAGQAIGGTPSAVAVSPDGSKVAYTYHHANCPPAVSCGTRYVLLYSHSDRATPVETFGKLYRNNPSWVSNDRILAFNGFLHQVNHDQPGGGNESDVHWFDDHEMFDPSTDLGDGELSRQGDRFAAIRGYGDTTHLMLYKVTENVIGGAASNPPAYACNTGNEPTLDSPTWSPDGTALAFAHKDGIEVIALPSVDPDCPGAGSGRVVIPGGSEPDWGPAPVNPGPRTPPPCVTGCDTPPPCATGCESPASKLQLKAPARAKLARLLRRGVTVTLAAPGAGKLSGALRLGARTVGRGSATARAAAPVRLKVEVVKKQARLLRKRRPAKLALTVTFKPAGGGTAQTARATIRVKR